MKRIVGVAVLSLLCGAVTLERSLGFGGLAPGGKHVGYARNVPGVQGPYGQPVPMAAPYNLGGISDKEAAAMMQASMPMDLLQTQGPGGPAMPPGMSITPPGVPAGPGMPGGMPPGMLAQGNPGMMPPMGAMPGAMPPPGMPPMGAMPGAMPPPGMPPMGAMPGGMPPMGGAAPQRKASRTSIRFVSPAGMKVAWYAPTGDGKQGFTSTQIETPGRYNFLQAAIYRLKLSDIPNRPNLELYPTLDVVPCNPKTEAFLAHSSVPISFTDEDFEQVMSGNYIVKVIYLPDPAYQDLATTGPDEVVSSRLEPGVDPIAEAQKRGSILVVVRMGNIDLEAPNTPPMDAPSPYQLKSQAPPGMMPGAMPPGMMPPGMMPMSKPTVPMVPYKDAGKMPPFGPVMMGPKGPMVMTPQGPMPVPQGPMMMGPNGPIPAPQGMMMGPNGPIPAPKDLPKTDTPVEVNDGPAMEGSGIQRSGYKKSVKAPSKKRPAKTTVELAGEEDEDEEEYEAPPRKASVAKKPTTSQMPTRLRRWSEFK